MRKVKVFVHGKDAGILTEIEPEKSYSFEYIEEYDGYPVSLTMPVKEKRFHFDNFPPFFDGVLPEGFMLDALLKHSKIDRNDHFSQLITTGKDLVGAITVEEIT
ncbi:MAG: HipA N-terminal domain-containing protein [Bacteroidota bacterium]